MNEHPFNQLASMVERRSRLRREVVIPVGVSWHLGVPALANRVIEEGEIDLVFLGRPALSNPHWTVWAARELGHGDPFSLLPQDWSFWLDSRRAHATALGWPEVVSPTSQNARPRKPAYFRK